ncbi:restriction endonuclease [Thiomicrospira sp. WB1]|uniref:restriction endonuclease n=1 Tax=Thiomicrospira sp. WB1 TaxID=1685380 RepID=UPI000749D87B|nr:restriction endonuclease [Thiomicrospira sp. WB1]KUJ72511.1 restriction endonuclease [Thiomicrospira sp. WB1]
MTIPDFQSVMLPVLKVVSSGEVMNKNDVVEQVSEAFRLSPEQRAELLPSGKQTVIKNRIGWAMTYLKKAGLVSSPKRAHIQVTDLGRQVLAQHPEKINVRFLKQYESFRQFHTAKPAQKATSESAQTDDLPETPDEQLQQAYQSLNASLAEELLESVKQVSPQAFEQLVVDLMLAMGYGGARMEAGQATQLTGDDGIDGIINEDKLGLDSIYLQAKRWENTVHRPEIDKFIGSLTRQGASKGVFITTSGFSDGALASVKNGLNLSVVLVDGQQLAELMIEHNLGVNIKETYQVKTLDSDYFDGFIG